MTTRRRGQSKRRAKRRGRLPEQHDQHGQPAQNTTRRPRDRRTDG